MSVGVCVHACVYVCVCVKSHEVSLKPGGQFSRMPRLWQRELWRRTMHTVCGQLIGCCGTPHYTQLPR